VARLRDWQSVSWTLSLCGAQYSYHAFSHAIHFSWCTHLHRNNFGLLKCGNQTWTAKLNSRYQTGFRHPFKFSGSDTCDTVALQARAAVDVCSVHEAYCLGPDQQYKSRAECMNFVLNRIPFGEIWQGRQNTVFCCYIHTPMVCIFSESLCCSRSNIKRNRASIVPAVHCPHVGPKDGNMCVDHPVSSFPSHITQCLNGNILVQKHGSRKSILAISEFLEFSPLKFV
jgi:hypothetical protein